MKGKYQYYQEVFAMNNDEIVNEWALKTLVTIPFGLGIMTGIMFTVGIYYTGYKVATIIDDKLCNRKTKNT